MGKGRGIPSRNLQAPRLASIQEEVSISQFTDGGGAAGTYQMQGALPAGAYIIGSRIIPKVACSGDTTAVITLGDGSDVDRYNTGTPSVFAAAAAGVDAGAPSGTRTVTTANRPTLTVTGGSDFGLVNTAGRVYVEIVYLVFSE